MLATVLGQKLGETAQPPSLKMLVNCLKFLTCLKTFLSYKILKLYLFFLKRLYWEDVGSSGTGWTPRRHPASQTFPSLCCCRTDLAAGDPEPAGGHSGQLADALGWHVLDVLAMQLSDDPVECHHHLPQCPHCQDLLDVLGAGQGIAPEGGQLVGGDGGHAAAVFLTLVSSATVESKLSSFKCS